MVTQPQEEASFVAYVSRIGPDRREVIAGRSCAPHTGDEDESCQPEWCQPAWARHAGDQHSPAATSAIDPATGSVASSWNLFPSPAGSGECGAQRHSKALTEIDTPQNENVTPSSVARELSWSLLGSLLAGVVTPYLGFGVRASHQRPNVGIELDIPLPDASVRHLAKATASAAEGLEQDLSHAFGNGVALPSVAYSPMPNALCVINRHEC